MIGCLAAAARTMREQAGRRQVDLTAISGIDASRFSEFEQGAAWPRDADRIVQAYADMLGIDAAEVWFAAYELMLIEEASEGVSDVAGTIREIPPDG